MSTMLTRPARWNAFAVVLLAWKYLVDLLYAIMNPSRPASTAVPWVGPDETWGVYLASVPDPVSLDKSPELMGRALEARSLKAERARYREDELGIFDPAMFDESDLPALLFEDTALELVTGRFIQDPEPQFVGALAGMAIEQYLFGRSLDA